MVKRVEGARLVHQRPFWSGSGIVALQVSPRVVHAVYVRVSRAQFARALQHQWTEPVPYPVSSTQRVYWHFEDGFYSDSDGFDAAKVRALILTGRQRRMSEAERAEAIVSLPEQRTQRRGRIPADVRQLVFRRDGHACAVCGDRHELQLDHVIPVSLGGSSEPQNLEVLCGPCNRRKGASLG